MAVDVVTGAGSLKSFVDSSAGQSCIIFSGQTSFSSSGAADVLGPLMDGGGRRLVVRGPLPTVEEVDRLADEVGADMPSMLLAVGGGLVIDTMKAVSLALATGSRVSTLLYGRRASGHAEFAKIAVPTTAGSGAERTPFAVIYRDGVKHSLDDGRVLPSVAVVDPELSRSAPRNVAAAAALDAMAHCVESTWACRSTTDSRKQASTALARIVEVIEPAVCDRSERAQDELMFAASDAGAAIAVTRTTAAHALSYHLTSEYGIPHGHAVALTLGRLAGHNEDVDSGSIVDERGVDHVRSVIESLYATFGLRDGAEFADHLLELIAALGLETDVDSAAGRPVDRRRWAAEVNAQRLANNPRRLSEGDLLEIIETA